MIRKKNIISYELAQQYANKCKVFEDRYTYAYDTDGDLLFCSYAYAVNGVAYLFDSDDRNNKNIRPIDTLSLIHAITHYELQEWLRETYKIDIDVNRGGISTDWYVGWMKFGHGYYRHNKVFNTYEAALDEGLKNALNLI